MDIIFSLILLLLLSLSLTSSVVIIVFVLVLDLIFFIYCMNLYMYMPFAYFLFGYKSLFYNKIIYFIVLSSSCQPAKNIFVTYNRIYGYPPKRVYKENNIVFLYIKPMPMPSHRICTISRQTTSQPVRQPSQQTGSRIVVVAQHSISIIIII